MKIAVLAAGTRGDVQPYLALALALQRAGHQAIFAGSGNTEALARLHGVPFSPLNVDFAELAARGRLRPVLRADRPEQFLVGAFRTMPRVLRLLQREAWAVCQDVEAAIYHPLMLPNVFYIGLHLGILAIPAALYPLYPTRMHPALPFYTGPRLGPTYNLATHRVAAWIIRLLLRPAIRHFWSQRLSPREAGQLLERDEAEADALYAYSEHVLPRPADWPDRIHITGFWFLEAHPGWQAPEELVRFVDAGPPPVYLGFGSMGGEADAERMTHVALEAVQDAGVRAILSAGWGGLGRGEELPASVLGVEDIPHGWLFPRMASVVHHGGIGTTAAAIRAGVPQVVVPHTGDQPIWSKRVHELGLAPPPIRLRRLSGRRLGEAIRQAVGDPTHRAHATELAEKVRAEGGLARAVEAIEEISRDPRVP